MAQEINLTLRNIATHNVPIVPLPMVSSWKLDCCVDFYHTGKFLVSIPRHFRWDGASIPRIAALTTGSGHSPKHILPSLIHDYLYRYGRKLGISRKKSDKIYQECLIACGLSRYTAWKEYTALRIAGKKHYR